MPRQRIRSWWWDYLVILGWLAVVFVTLGLPTLFRWVDLSSIWRHQASSDVAITLLTVVPVLAYFTTTESGPRRASWGKRRAGLEITATDRPGDVTAGRALLRNIVKLLPWQFGHLAATRFVTASDVTVPAMAFYVVSMVLLAGVALPPLVGRRGLHEVVSGTSVEQTEVQGQPSSPAPV